MKTIRQLFTETFKADPQEMMNTMSWHETGPNQRLNPKAVQILKDGSEGEGKGKYQFEAPALRDAARFLKMTHRQSQKGAKAGEWEYPEWIHKVVDEKDNAIMTDARELTEEQQDELFLANLMMKKNSDADIKSALDSGDYTNLWLVHHWGGSAGDKGFTEKQLKQVADRESDFKESAGSYKQFKVEMEKQQRQQYAGINQVMNDNLLQADKKVAKEPEQEPEEYAEVASVIDIENQGVLGPYTEAGKPEEY